MPRKTSKKIIWIIVITAIIAIELVFDIFEIVMGRYLLVINPMRPQIGRLWEEEQKDVLAEQEVSQVETTAADSIYTYTIPDFNELLKLLDQKDLVILEKNIFLNFYKRIDANVATSILDPLIVYDLDRQNNWRFVKVSKMDQQISFSFLDGFSQPLNESFINSKCPQSGPVSLKSGLDREPNFNGRIVTAAAFFQAFDQLSRSYRLQIINNPFRLIQIKDDLVRVGLSKYSANGSVELAFEVKMGNTASVHKMAAAEMAVSYLISSINKTGQYNIALPTKEEVKSE